MSNGNVFSNTASVQSASSYQTNLFKLLYTSVAHHLGGNNIGIAVVLPKLPITIVEIVVRREMPRIVQEPI